MRPMITYRLSDFDLYSIIAQDDFRGGIGQLELQDTTKYAWGYRVDSRGERVSLGVKVDSSQPDSQFDDANTIGLLDLQLHMNSAFAKEPDSQVSAWTELHGNLPSVAIPFSMIRHTTRQKTTTQFTPDDIDGLMLWLESDNVVTDMNGNVEEWPDKSSYNNDFRQIEEDRRPKLVAQDTPAHHPGLEADGVDDYLRASRNTLPEGSQTRTLFLVVKSGKQCTNLDCRDVLDLGRDGGEGTHYRVWNDVTLCTSGRPYPSGRRYWNKQIGTSDYKIACIRQMGTNTSSLEYWENGSKIGPSYTRNVKIDTVPERPVLFAKNLASGGTDHNGHNFLAAVLVYDHALTDADRERVETYLSDKFFTAQVDPPPDPPPDPPDPPIVPKDTNVRRLWAYLRAGQRLEGAVTLSIYEDLNGYPGAPVTGASGVVPAVEFYGKWVSADFDAPVELDTDKKYWMVLDATNLDPGESVEVITGWTGQSEYCAVKRSDVGWDSKTGYTFALTAQFFVNHPDTPPVKFVMYKDDLYALAGLCLYKVDDVTVVNPVEENDKAYMFPSDGVDMLVVHHDTDTEDKLLVIFGQGVPMQIWDGSAWTILDTGTTDSDRDADAITLHDNLWWRASKDDDNGVFVQGTKNYKDWSTAGTAGPRVKVGDSKYPVRAIFSWKGQLYVAKVDGLYIVTYNNTYPAEGTQAQANMILNLQTEVHPNNFMSWTIWHDELFFALSTGIARFSASNVLSSVTPDSSLLHRQRDRGAFTAMASTLSYLYVFYQSGMGDWSLVMAYNGDWYSIATSDRTGDIARAMFVDASLVSVMPRIWSSSHCSIMSFMQPTWSSRMWTFLDQNENHELRIFDKANGPWERKPRGFLYSSWIDGGLINIPKQWADLSVLVSNVSPDVKISVNYRSDEEGEWQALGSISEGSLGDFSFPHGFSSIKLQLRFDFYTERPTISPLLHGYALRYIPRPDTKMTFQMQLTIADDLELHNGAIEMRSVVEQWRDLVKARNATGGIVFVDPDGTEDFVHIENLSRQLVERKEINDTTVQNIYLVTATFTEA